MDLNDLYKLAGISRDDTPAIEPQPVEQVAEQPTDGREDMRAMIALITPDQLNQLVGEAPVEEGDEYAASTTPNPQEYKGTLGSPSDNSLRRYLGAAGDHVTVDEDVYPDHTVESVSEAYQSFKAEGKYGKKKKKYKEEVNEDAGKVGYMEMFFTDRDGGEVSQEVQVTLADGKLSVTGDMPGPEDDMYWDDADIEEQLRDAMQDIERGMSVISWMNEDTIDEADVEENAFNQAAAAAARANKSEFEFGGKTHKTTMKKDTAHKLDDDINVLKQLAGMEQSVTEDPSKPDFPMEIELAGDSIWDKEDKNPKTVTVTDYNMDKDEEGYVSLYVDHDGPWTVYTDSGFEKAISEMVGMEVGFSEQGMQEDGKAHLEGNDEDVTLEQSAGINRLKQLSGLAMEDVDQQYADVLASKNQIKINAFLQGLDSATATRLTGGKAQTSKISADGQTISPSGDTYKHGEPGLSKQTIKMAKPIADR